MKNIQQAIASSYPFRTIAILGIAALIGACEAGNEATYNSAGSPEGGAQEKIVTSQAAQPSPAAQPQPLQDSSLLQRELTEEQSGETYAPIEENPFYQVSSKPLSTFAIDVDAASYSNVRRFINEGQRPPQDAVRIEELINYFNYEYPQPEGDQPFSVSTEISQAPWNPAHQLVHIGLQGKNIARENLPPSNLVFLLDVSGSMSDRNKLPLLQSAFRLLVDELSEKDQVSIVVYAGAAGVVLPPTPGNQKDKILAAINQLESGGSTAGGEGIKQAYKLAKENFIESGNNRVILATDGDFNVGVSSDAELVRLIEQKREEGVFLTVLGFGTGNLQDTKMEKLANKGNGNYAYIDNLLEAKKVLVTEMGGTLLTIAKDVKIQVAFNQAKVQGYRLIGYENRRLQNQDFQDDTKDAGELGAGHSVTALYEIIPVGVNSDVTLAVGEDSQEQENPGSSASYGTNDVMQVKLRYKQPQGTTSQLLTYPVVDQEVKLENASNNFKFSAAVAAFGMVLRNSQYKGTANFEQVLQLANQSQAEDLNGYRAEFIRLVKQVEE
ncbi:MAG: VWA domain-containing protein [Symploca sp. SIO1B1]|nr:VWA domain-containing protein [Symploca sp. SIO1B1]